MRQAFTTMPRTRRPRTMAQHRELEAAAGMLEFMVGLGSIGLLTASAVALVAPAFGVKPDALGVLWHALWAVSVAWLAVSASFWAYAERKLRG